RRMARQVHDRSADRRGTEVLQPPRAARVPHLRHVVGRAPRGRGRHPFPRPDGRLHVRRPGRDLVAKTMLIAGDVGGTKTDLGIYSPGGGPEAPVAKAQFPSADYPSLQAIVAEFLAQVKLSIDAASFDVAGPVIDGHVKATNLPWTMDEGLL